MNKVIYAGSFDPITNGHLDIIQQSLSIFEHTRVVIMHNDTKNCFFSVNERINLIKEATKQFGDKVSVDYHGGLLVDYCEKTGIHTVVRGLRALTDFDYEFQMALTNKQLNHKVESVLLVTNILYSYVSSSLVKEIASYQGDISRMVPENVEIALKNKFKQIQE